MALTQIKHAYHQLRLQLPYLPQAFKLVWEAARLWTLTWAILLLVQGLLPTANVLLTRVFVNSLVSVFHSNRDWATLSRPLFLALIMALVLLLGEVLRSITTWVRTAQAELVRDHIYHLIHEQAMHLDLTFYETPEYYDQLHRARVDAISGPVALLENTGSLIQNCITVVALAGVLVTYAWWLPIALFLSTMPALLVAGFYIWRFHQWRLKNTTNERRIRYYDWMLTSHEAAAELRLFDLGKYFCSAFQSLREKLRNQHLKLAKKQMLAEAGAGFVTLFFMGLTMIWLIWHSVGGRRSLGDLALFYQVFNQGLRVMRGLLASVGEIYRNILFLENIFQFLALKPTVVNSQKPSLVPVKLCREIRLERVTFRYPGSQRSVLKDFSITFPPGKIAAIVGENGAGKSTLIKLLCRFYDPDAGKVMVDGVDLRALQLTELRRQITILFQQPVKYHDTVAANITFGDQDKNACGEDVKTAARDGGADKLIDHLPEGFDTVLGKWFGGTELSVGEWQRLALARAFFRQASLIMLDEPTSAMDSWAEADWMARFRDLVRGRTAIIITHRFTTALQADLIHVMEKGRVVESGSHTELLSLKGRYAESWRKQMSESQKNDFSKQKRKTNGSIFH